MSKSLNKVTLIGNLGSDPEVRTAGTSGLRVATLSLATSRQWKNGHGEPQEKTQWHRVICWNSAKGQQLADIAEKYCRKGGKVYIEGEIEYRTWQDKEGQTRYSTEINCRELILLGDPASGTDARRETDPYAPLEERDRRHESKARSVEYVPDALDDDSEIPF